MVQQTTYYKLGIADGNHSNAMASMWVKCWGSQADLCIPGCFVYASTSAWVPELFTATNTGMLVLAAATLPNGSEDRASAPHLEKDQSTSQVQPEHKRIIRLWWMQMPRVKESILYTV